MHKHVDNDGKVISIDHYHIESYNINPLRIWIDFSIGTIMLNIHTILVDSYVISAIFGRLMISITLFMVLAFNNYNIVSQYLSYMREVEVLKNKEKKRLLNEQREKEEKKLRDEQEALNMLKKANKTNRRLSHAVKSVISFNRKGTLTK